MIHAKKQNAYGLSNDQDQVPSSLRPPITKEAEKRRKPVDRSSYALLYGFFSRCWRRTVVGALGTGGGALVAGITRDTHDCED